MSGSYECSERLRRVVERADDSWMALHGNGLPTFCDLTSATALLARIESSPPYTPSGDSLLADLLRVHRRCPRCPALNAALYAAHREVLRHCVPIARRFRTLEDGEALVLSALGECLCTMAPDRRSENVQAGLVRDVACRLRRSDLAERKERQLRSRVCEIARHAAADLDAGVFALSELIEPRGRRAPREHVVVDHSLAEDFCEALVRQKLLFPRQATLVCQVDIQDRPAADVARSQGLTLAAALKALQRARNRLRLKKERVESIWVSQFAPRLTTSNRGHPEPQ